MLQQQVTKFPLADPDRGENNMKKVYFIAVIVLLTAFIITSIAIAGTATNDKDEKSDTEKVDTDNSVRQEFIWDDTEGTFRKVDLFSTWEVNEKLKNMEQKLSADKKPDDTFLCAPSSYTYWDGDKWVTLESVSRFEGGDQRAEGLVTRFDLTQYTFSTSDWDTITGYQSIYSSYSSYQSSDQENGSDIVKNPPDKNAKPKTKFSSKEFGSPDSYDPVVEVQLANGWKVTINSRYDKSGVEVKLTSPDGNTSFIYGDSNITEGSSSGASLANLENYVSDLDGYTLKLETEEDEKGGYRISNIILSGPNGYQLTFNRNNEVRVYGGTR